MIRWDEVAADLIWLASLVLAALWPWTMWLVLATTLNLLCIRYIHWFAGLPFRERLRRAVTEDMLGMNSRIESMEKDVADIRESQVRMQGAWRGRNLPT